MGQFSMEKPSLTGSVLSGNQHLGHSQPQTTARYAHLDADPLRRAANTIGNTIAGAMAGKTSNVTLLKREA